MAKSRKPEAMTHEDWKNEEARLLGEINHMRSQREILSQALSELKHTKHSALTSRRSPGRFKGQIHVPQVFFDPLSEDDLREITGA